MHLQHEPSMHSTIFLDDAIIVRGKWFCSKKIKLERKSNFECILQHGSSSVPKGQIISEENFGVLPKNEPKISAPVGKSKF
jgi:hypothetical protein